MGEVTASELMWVERIKSYPIYVRIRDGTFTALTMPNERTVGFITFPVGFVGGSVTDVHAEILIDKEMVHVLKVLRNARITFRKDGIELQDAGMKYFTPFLADFDRYKSKLEAEESLLGFERKVLRWDVGDAVLERYVQLLTKSDVPALVVANGEGKLRIEKKSGAILELAIGKGEGENFLDEENELILTYQFFDLVKALRSFFGVTGDLQVVSIPELEALFVEFAFDGGDRKYYVRCIPVEGG